MKPIVVEVRGQVAAPIERVFDVFMPIDLRKIMVGYGPLPAVTAIEDQTGDWSSVGESRIIRLADGHGMLEVLTAVDRPRRFAYTISDLTNVLRFLVTRFHGEWNFEAVEQGPVAGPDLTRATWRYSFEPRSALARPIALFVLTQFWRPCMQQGLELATAEMAS
ncbi:MAG: SRPBCC family protein [Myxococcota bacterium]